MIIFENKLQLWEIPLFRGSIIDLVEGDDMYHNHQGDGYIYRYPMIQYKRIKGQAAILAIDDGVEQIGKLMNADRHHIKIGEREEDFMIQHIIPSNFLIQPWESLFEYHIRHWFALNQENHAKYNEITSLVDRLNFLQKVLVGNILSMCKGLRITIDREITCEITHINDPMTVKYKGNPMMSFDVDFRCNVSLPDYIGLGKAVSLGHGTVVRAYDNNQ